MEITEFPAQHDIVVPAEFIAEVQAGGIELERVFNSIVQGELFRAEQHRRRNARRTSDEMDPPFVPSTPRQMVDEAKATLASYNSASARVAQGLVSASMRLESLNRLVGEAQSAKDRNLDGNRAMIRAKIVEAEQIAFDLSQALNDTLEALGQ